MTLRNFGLFVGNEELWIICTLPWEAKSEAVRYYSWCQLTSTLGLGNFIDFFAIAICELAPLGLSKSGLYILLV